MRPALRAHVTALAVVAAAIALPDAVPSAAPKKGKQIENVWTHPEFTSFGVDRVALVPVATYSNDYQAEKVVESAIGQAFRAAGYRWISATSTREMLRSPTAGDSVLKAAKGLLLKNGRIDSLSAPGLCRQLRCDALLTARVDHWEKLEMEWNQAGKPSTTVQMRMAMVDSTGALLWSAAGSQTGEGPYHDPSANPIAVRDVGLERKPVTGQGGAPSYEETVMPLLTRWAARFPGKMQVAPGVTIVDSLVPTTKPQDR